VLEQQGVEFLRQWLVAAATARDYTCLEAAACSAHVEGRTRSVESAGWLLLAYCVNCLACILPGDMRTLQAFLFV
jgi:hypothetical protein